MIICVVIDARKIIVFVWFSHIKLRRGFLKTRLRMDRGQLVTTESFKDGEVPGPPSLTAAGK